MSNKDSKNGLVIAVVAIGLAFAGSKAVAVPKKAISGSAPAPVPVIASVPTVTIPVPSKPVVVSSDSRLVDLCEQAIYKEVPARRLSPTATRTLAVNLVSVCKQENYPLDLAFGHAYVESNLELRAKNKSSGAIGPLQVTSVVAEQFGAHWPIESPVLQLELGIKYMQWLRRTYPDAAKSVRDCLRMYGMGPGNYQKFKSGQLSCSTRISVARAELGCTGNRPYTATAISIAKRHPELRTVAWWGS